MRDLRDAVRSLLGTPIVSAVAIFSLALGIGANTAIFSIINSLLLRTLPVREPQRLALLVDASGTDTWTHPIWKKIEEHSKLFDGLLAWSTERFNLTERGETDYAQGIYASGSFFEALGVPAILGRTFGEDDNRRDGGSDGPVAVISYGFWQKRFGGAVDVVGRKLSLSGVPFTVVGVTGPEFFGPEVGSNLDVVVPIGTEPLIRGGDSWIDHRSAWWLQVMARLKPGQSFESATTAVRGVQPQIRESTIPERWRPQDIAEYLSSPLALEPAATGTSSLRGRYRQPLAAILTVVGLVLLIACANIANLQLARAHARRHEMSVRLALGASRFRLARLLLVESLTLSLLGAGAGLGVSIWGGRLLVNQLSTQTRDVFLDLTLDWRVMGFTALVAVGTALLFGLVPAFRSSHIEPIEALKERGRGGDGSARFGLHNTLVVAQIALSLLLVVAAGLFGQTFSRLAHLDLGFQQDRVLVVNCSQQREEAESVNPITLYQTLEESVSSLPGVARAATSLVTPMGGFVWNERVKVTDGPELSDRDRVAHVNIVSPGWFATLGTSILAGRDFDDRDREGAPEVALVNQAFARRFMGGESPVGRTFRQDGGRQENPPLIEIVGLVEDAVYRSLRDPVPPTVYLPLWQSPDRPPFFSLSVRSSGRSPASLTQSVAEAISRSDKDLQITFRPLAEQIDSALIQERLVALLSAFFGGLALLLAGLGLYGVTSYAVSRRRFEIGVRMALGASPRLVVRLVIKRVAFLVGMGVVAGGIVALWSAGLAQGLLFGLKPHDPVTYALAAASLVLVGAVAGWLPARRASRLDPAETLRRAN